MLYISFDWTWKALQDVLLKVDEFYNKRNSVLTKQKEKIIRKKAKKRKRSSQKYHIDDDGEDNNNVIDTNDDNENLINVLTNELEMNSAVFEQTQLPPDILKKLNKKRNSKK